MEHDYYNCVAFLNKLLMTRKECMKVKTNKILKVMCTAIIIMLLVFVAFIGVYVQKNGTMENIIKEYKLGMELGGGREIVLTPSTDTKTVYTKPDGKKIIDSTKLTDEEKASYTSSEEKVNSSEVLTADNYKKAKDIFKKRLDAVGLSEYQISSNDKSGDIIIKAYEDTVLDNVIYTLFAKGNLILVDSDTFDVLINNDDIKEAKVGYNATSSGTGIYLTIQLNEQGTKKLSDISKNYVKTKDANGTETEKTVSLYMDGQNITTSYFGQQINNGILQLSIGTASTNSSALTNYVTEASNLAIMLSTGDTNIQYTMSENQYIASDLTETLAILLLYAAVIIVTAAMIYIVVEYKERGIVASAAFLGYIAALLLAVRLSNVVITIESIGAILLSVVFTYVFINILLSKLSKYRENDSTPKAEMNKTIITSLFTLAPALVISVIFCFITYMAINSFGTALFWGVAVFVIYTLLIIKPLLLNFEYLFEEEK